MARSDHLFYYRAAMAYSHHGIDCGDGSVIHYESSLWRKLSSVCVTDRAPQVVRSTWAEFALGADVFVRQYAPEADAHEIVLARAESRLGESSYHLWGNNCEHFAVWCKTGRAESSQVGAIQAANRYLLQHAPLSLAMVRTARRLPPQLRPVAYGGAAAVAGSSFLSAYLRRRLELARERQS